MGENMMEQDNPEKTKNKMDLYNRKYIVHEIIKEATGRDFSALSKAGANIRALRVKCIFDLDRALKVMNWETKLQNLYIGCSRLKDIPNFTFNPVKRSSETSVWYHEKYSDLVETYDLFFDFDRGYKCPDCGLSENHLNGLVKKGSDTLFCKKCNKEFLKGDCSMASIHEVLKDAKILKEYLDEYEVPYYIVFSGNKGFQIIVDGKYVPIEKIEMGNVYPHKTVQEKIKIMLDLNYLDSANTGINSRLRKVPYSLVPNGETDEQEMNMALPLSDSQLDNFRLENMKVKLVMTQNKLMRRGTLERFENLSLEQKKENVQDFINVFSFK